MTTVIAAGAVDKNKTNNAVYPIRPQFRCTNVYADCFPVMFLLISFPVSWYANRNQYGVNWFVRFDILQRCIYGFNSRTSV